MFAPAMPHGAYVGVVSLFLQRTPTVLERFFLPLKPTPEENVGRDTQVPNWCAFIYQVVMNVFLACLLSLVVISMFLCCCDWQYTEFVDSCLPPYC